MNSDLNFDFKLFKICTTHQFSKCNGIYIALEVHVLIFRVRDTYLTLEHCGKIKFIDYMFIRHSCTQSMNRVTLE